MLRLYITFLHWHCQHSSVWSRHQHWIRLTATVCFILSCGECKKYCNKQFRFLSNDRIYISRVVVRDDFHGNRHTFLLSTHLCFHIVDNLGFLNNEYITTHCLPSYTRIHRNETGSHTSHKTIVRIPHVSHNPNTRGQISIASTRAGFYGLLLMDSFYSLQLGLGGECKNNVMNESILYSVY